MPNLPPLQPDRRIDRSRSRTTCRTRYIVRGGLRTPDARDPQPVVCSVWQADDGALGVRLITAYPD